MSLNTFRVVIHDTPENNNDGLKSPLEFHDDKSMIIYDITPSKLEFRSDVEEEGNKFQLSFNKFIVLFRI